MSKPMVAAYLRKNGEIYIHAISLLRGIAGVVSEPYLAHELKDNCIDLGNSVLQAKEGSLDYLERENYRDYIPPYYEWAGVTKSSQFAKHTKSVSIDFIDEHIRFSSMVNKRGIWYTIDDKVATLDVDSTAEQIGEQLLRSFEDAIA